MQTIWFYAVLGIITLISSACEVQPGRPIDSAFAEEATGVESQSPTAAAPQVETAASLLLWEGPALFAENPTECHRLQITNDNKALVGPCTGLQTIVEFAANNNGGLADMLSRFAPFELNTPDERLIFNGHGQISGPAWQRAITAWARFTQAELASGHVGAANRTVLAWNLGQPADQPEQCRMLIVLVHGYAMAGLTPCAGGSTTGFVGGWLDSADWEQFDGWLYDRAPLYQDNSYFDGRGTTAMNATETTALAEWANSVYAKLVSDGGN